MNNVLTIFSKLLKSKDFWIRMLFIVIAAIFWFLIKLSKNGYVASLEYPVLYENVPFNKLIVGNPSHKITLRISSFGFRLLGYELKNVKPLKIDIKKHTRKSASKKDIYYWLPNLYREEFEAQLDRQTSLLRLEPDTVYLVLSEKIRKEVPVQVNVKTKFKKGYQAYGIPVIKPEKITVYGPKILLDSIAFVETKEKVINTINANVEEEIELKVTDPLISLSANSITYLQEVDQFTEKVLQVPIRLTNVPKGYKATIMPAVVDVFCKVALRDIDQLQSNDIEVICDFNQLREFPNRKHLQLSINTPTGVFEIINTSHQSVNFLLFKQ